MSGAGFHVHGPHDHAVEHAASGRGAHGDEGDNNFASRIAVMTAIISTVGALFSYQGGATQNDAMLYKNNAAIKKTEASNQWNYYQAKSNKQNLAELAMALPGVDIEKYKKEVARYKTEKDDIKKEAEALEAASKKWDEESEKQIHLHHRWAQAMTVMQVAIALAAITLLTRKRWMSIAVFVATGIGGVLAAMAMLHM
jgi:lipopolysaccharide export LptBFGC system permease protein LptF